MQSDRPTGIESLAEKKALRASQLPALAATVAEAIAQSVVDALRYNIELARNANEYVNAIQSEERITVETSLRAPRVPIIPEE